MAHDKIIISSTLLHNQLKEFIRADIKWVQVEVHKIQFFSSKEINVLEIPCHSNWKYEKILFARHRWRAALHFLRTISEQPICLQLDAEDGIITLSQLTVSF